MKNLQISLPIIALPFNMKPLGWALILLIISCKKVEIQTPALEKSFQDHHPMATTNISDVSPNLIYEETFEEAAPFTFYSSLQVSTPYGFSVVSSPVYSGTKAVRFELRDTDPMVGGGTRAEARFPSQSTPERWYAYSVYFPGSNYLPDSSSDIISQWHQGLGESPSISVRTKHDRLTLEIRPLPSLRTKYDIGPLIKDKWQSLVLHIIHSDKLDGLVEMWKDGIKVLNIKGPNSYDSTYDKPKWKLGLYKSDWNDTATTLSKIRAIYFDNIRLGNENACFADVDPSLIIRNFSFINATTEKDILTIREDETYSLKQLGTSRLNIRANPIFNLGSVKFELIGPQTRTFIDNAVPYTLMGDNGLGNYYYGIWGPPTPGSYTLKATPYPLPLAGGLAGNEAIIHFTLTN